MHLPVFLLVILELSGSAFGCARFENTAQIVSEALGTVQVCVQFTAVVTNGGTLTVAPNTIGDARSPDDFDATSRDFAIPINNTDRVCHDIPIMEDNIFEDVETFRVELISTNLLICPTDNSTLVGISDSTRLFVSFAQSIYTTVNERGVQDVCLDVPTDVVYERGVTFTLVGLLSEATAGTGDFRFVSPTLIIRDVSVICAGVQITSDDEFDTRVEEDEFFDIMLTTSDTLTLVGGNTRVIITDDDGAEVSLVTEQFELEEGNSGTTNVSFCIRLDSSLRLDRDVVLLLNTAPLEATSTDYQEVVDANITIPAGSSQGFVSCGMVSVIGDEGREPNETFTVEVTAQNGNDRVTAASFRVTILDDGDMLPDCGTLPDPPNGMVTLSGTVQGSSAIYSCNNGFEFSPIPVSTTRTCLGSGAWNFVEPTCEITVVDCGTLSLADGAIDFTLSTVFESIAIHTCNVGFVFTSGVLEFNRTCQANGEWSQTPPSCRVLDCGELPHIFFGIVDQSEGTELGAVTTYTCDPGFILVGSSTRECGIDEMWTDSEPSCANLTLSVEGSSTDIAGPILSGIFVQSSIDVTLNGTALGLPADLIPLSTISWFEQPGNVLIISANMTKFLELDRDDVLVGNVDYTCKLEIVSDLFPEGFFNTTTTFNLVVLNPIPPTTEGISTPNTPLIVGIAVGLGAAVLALILCVGILVICFLCWRRKKNYRKYVLPYRAYMDTYKNSNAEEPPISSNKTRQPKLSVVNENGRREHVLAAVNMHKK